VHLYAAAIVLERVVGWSPLTAAVILVCGDGVFTIAGGLAAVILHRSGANLDPARRRDCADHQSVWDKSVVLPGCAPRYPLTIST